MCYTFISCILLLALMCLKLPQSDLELLNIMNLDFRKTCCGSILIGFRAEGKDIWLCKMLSRKLFQ